MWRGIACLAVVLYHATYFVTGPHGPGQEFQTQLFQSPGQASVWDWLLLACTRGWIGVPIFFVVSGYCIAAAADSHLRNQRTAGSYFWRRFKRIFPPYWVAMLGGMLFFAAVEYVSPGLLTGDDIHPHTHPRELSWIHWLGNLSLTEEWRYNFGGPGKILFLSQAWTLCYEEQFYIVVGLAMLAFPRKLWWALAAITAIVYANALINFNVGPVAKMGINLNFWKLECDGMFIDGKWLEFAAGLLIYYTVNYGDRWSKLDSGLGLFCLFAWNSRLWSPAWLARFQEFNPNVEQFRCAAFAFALIALILHKWDQQIAQSLIGRPLAWLGTMCYSIYLVHFPLEKALSHWLTLQGFGGARNAILVVIPICTLATLVVAWAFHRLVERRFLNARSVA